MMKFLLLSLICLTFNQAITGQEKEDIEKTIIGIEKATLDRWEKGDPMGFVEIAAEDITYFDPFLESRIDGLEAFRAYMKGVEGQIYADRYELLNPTVHSNGKVAVLCFNYVSYTEKEGETNESRWNATEVYKRIDGSWKLCHSHWSMTLPELK